MLNPKLVLVAVAQLRDLAETHIRTAKAANAAYAEHEPHEIEGYNGDCKCDLATDPLQAADDDAAEALEDALTEMCGEPKADVTSIPVPLLLQLLKLIEVQGSSKPIYNSGEGW